MTNGLTSTQARTIATSDLVIYNEIDVITRAIYTAALAGDLNTTVSDGTTITESTPTITVVGTETNPESGSVGESLTLAGQGVSIPANSDINQIIAAINDAGITGLTASKNDAVQVVLTYEPPQSSWSFAIGADSANTTIGLTSGTVTATNPESVNYYNVWTGISDDRKKSYELSQVVNHFQGLGYSILAKQNADTPSNVIKWEIYW